VPTNRSPSHPTPALPHPDPAVPRTGLRALLRTLALAWTHAALGGTAGLAALTVALIPAVVLIRALASGPGLIDLATWPAATLALLFAAGLPRFVRRASLALATPLLTTPSIPESPASRPPAFGSPASGSPASGRVRSGVWVVVHAVLGGALVLGTVVAVGVAVAAPVVWLGAGDGRMTYLGLDLHLRGAEGLVTVPLVLGHLVVAVLITWGYAVVLRWAAPLLLGPGAAERLAAERQRADALAHRNRLARELHDSIGHTLTASTLQAAAAGRLLDTTAQPDPHLLRQTLTAIEESSRTALDDLDQALSSLRTPDTPTGPIPPARTLADLPALFDRLRVAGLTVDATGVTGLAGVPEEVSREAYRIVQEGLTNALRYADPATVTVGLTLADDDRLLIELTNPTGTEDLPVGTGRGLAGITERVHLLRGHTEAGPTSGADDGNGWRLAVWLPVGPA
jgi:signal transduction histidine kinase